MYDPPFSERIARLISFLDNSGVSAAIVLNLTNIRYFTGFTGSDGALIIGASVAFLLVDGRYVTQASRKTSGFEVIEFRDKLESTLRIIEEAGIFTVGFESSTMSYDQYLKLREKDNGLSLKPLGDNISNLGHKRCR